MKIKNVVKVMNFHSLLRVDSSRRNAEKYFGYEQSVREFIDKILYNKNLILDKKMIKMNDSGKELNIYIANDLGFCGSFNSNINEVLRQSTEDDKIIIGKKIAKNKKYENIIFSMSKEEYFDKIKELNKFLTSSVENKVYKTVNLIYNHYYNVSKIERVKEQIFPFEKIEKNEKYNEDFVIEGDINKILINVIALYLSYEIKVAVENSYASENLMRQMITKESLKKIDEIEEQQRIKNIKLRKMKNLKKQLDIVNKSKYED